MDIREERSFLISGDIELLLANSTDKVYLSIRFFLLSLLAHLSDAFLNCVNVHLDHVLSLFRGLILSRFFRLVVFLLDKPHLFVQLVERLTDLNFSCLCDSRFDNTHQQRLEEIKQKLVSRLLEDDLQVLDFDLDVVDLEDSVAIFGFSGSKFDVE